MKIEKTMRAERAHEHANPATACEAIIITARFTTWPPQIMLQLILAIIGPFFGQKSRTNKEKWEKIRLNNNKIAPNKRKYIRIGPFKVRKTIMEA